MRRILFVLTLLIALALLASAVGVLAQVTLTNGHKFRGYKTLLEARKDSTKPAAKNVIFSIVMFKGSQSHTYTFKAASSSFTTTATLSSGTLSFTANAPLQATGPASCKRAYRYGTTTGPLKAAIKFVGMVTHNGSVNANTQKQPT